MSPVSITVKNKAVLGRRFHRVPARSAEQTARSRICHAEAATRRSKRRLSQIAKGLLTRCSKRAHARIAKGGSLIFSCADRRRDARASTREHRDTWIDILARQGRTRHRYRGRCFAHHHGCLRCPSGRGRPGERDHRNRPAAGKAARYPQRDYPRSSAGKPVYRISLRGSGSAPALGF
jgi:hypothetical protein